jgi:hypothetical protein
MMSKRRSGSAWAGTPVELEPVPIQERIQQQFRGCGVALALVTQDRDGAVELLEAAVGVTIRREIELKRTRAVSSIRSSGGSSDAPSSTAR